MSPFRRIIDRLRRTALHGLSVPALFTCYRETRDEASITELVKRSTPGLRVQCRPYLQDRDEIDEVVREVFRLLIEQAASIRDANGIEAWLAQTAVNVARNRSRRQALRTPTPMAPEVLAVADPQPGPDLLAELREKYAYVLSEIEQLKEDWKRALQLKLLEERPYSEVAELLGASLDKVKQDVSRARKQLRRQLTRKGIVLPAALAGVLLGESARGSTPLVRAALLTAAIGFAIGAIVLIVRNPDRPLPASPFIQVVAPPAPEPMAEDVVLDRVVSLMDQLTGMKTWRTEIIENGPRRVRWRMAWAPDPSRDPKKTYPFSAMVTDNSYSDLIFDRWSGNVGMDVSFDGKTAKNIDPLRPIIIGPPGFELVYHIPELGKIHQTFSLMLSNAIPETNRVGPLRAEPVPAVIDREGRANWGRVEPDQGVNVRLEPNESLILNRLPSAKGQNLVVSIWRPGMTEPVRTLKHESVPWSYRNDTGEARNFFIAGINAKTVFAFTCAPRLTVRGDGTRIVDFDENYDGGFDEARLEVVVK